jgi:CBS domain-containing protein
MFVYGFAFVRFTPREVKMNTAKDMLKDKNREMLCVSHDQSVHEVVELMVKSRIGAILVKKKDDIVGIWTERDLLRHSATPGFDPGKARIGDYMSSPLHSAPYDAPLESLEEMFLGLFIRHLLIEKEGRYIGLLSIGDVMRANLLEKDRKIKELNSLASWQYYENWGWKRKK